MSVVEQPREMTQQDKIDWDYSYPQGGGLDNWFPNPIDFVVKNCCDNCDYFAESEMEFAEGFCMKNVANTLCGQYIEGKDTFYCSYHKLRINNE